MAFEIHLDNFTGPLDLLLHLIKTNEMDIYDIQMVEITEQYLTVVEQMKQLDLEIAGEFLLMAATLIHIKSRMLLPVSDEPVEEEDEDPRAELVRRLLEYQRYKQAAEALEALPQLERDVFVSRFVPTEIADSADETVSLGVFQLAEAYYRILSEVPAEVFHEVIREPLSVAQYVQLVVRQLADGQRHSFRRLVAAWPSRAELVVTFLAMLELVKMRLVEIDQVADYGDIWLKLRVAQGELAAVDLAEDGFGYG